MSVLNSDAIPQPEKSMVQQQQDLADEILEILDVPRHQLDTGQYESIRAAIAHYTVTLQIGG
jgi:hypothetical protein